MNNDRYYTNRKVNRYKREIESLKFWLKIYTAILLVLVGLITFLIFIDAKKICETAEEFKNIDTKENTVLALINSKNEEDVFVPELISLGNFSITHYCACSVCCGEWSDGITFSGTKATAGRTIAVDPDVIPYGSEVAVFYDDGRICYYIAEDCGGEIKGNEIDVFVDSHAEALELGVMGASVYLVSNIAEQEVNRCG